MKKLSNAFTTLLFAASLGSLTVCLNGCFEETSTHRPAFDYSQPQVEDEFQKGADRPPTTKTLYTLAMVLVNQGRDAHAEAILQRLISEYPEFIPAYNSLAELKMRQRRIDQAIETLNKGLNVSPEDPVLVNNRGMCWMIRQDYPKALEDFTRAAGLMPQNARYRANMAVALAFLGRDEEALSLYKQILPQDKAKHNLSIIQRARQR